MLAKARELLAEFQPAQDSADQTNLNLTNRTLRPLPPPVFDPTAVASPARCLRPYCRKMQYLRGGKPCKFYPPCGMKSPPLSNNGELLLQEVRQLQAAAPAV